jgi:hypothetical protein
VHLAAWCAYAGSWADRCRSAATTPQAHKHHTREPTASSTMVTVCCSACGHRAACSSTTMQAVQLACGGCSRLLTWLFGVLIPAVEAAHTEEAPATMSQQSRPQNLTWLLDVLVSAVGSVYAEEAQLVQHTRCCGRLFRPQMQQPG